MSEMSKIQEKRMIERAKMAGHSTQTVRSVIGQARERSGAPALTKAKGVAATSEPVYGFRAPERVVIPTVDKKPDNIYQRIDDATKGGKLNKPVNPLDAPYNPVLSGRRSS